MLSSVHPRRRRSDREPRLGWRPAVRIAVAVAGLDWTTKALVGRWVPRGELVEVVPGRVAFWHVRNRAMMLGLWGDLPLGARRTIAILAAILALLVLGQIIQRGHRLQRAHRPWAWAFAGLALGGVAGNLGERAVHWGVTDFLSLRWGDLWLPPGNVADLALFLSFFLVVPLIVFELRARALRGKLPPEPPSSAAGMEGGGERSERRQRDGPQT